jgi:hypothetical protein
VRRGNIWSGGGGAGELEGEMRALTAGKGEVNVERMESSNVRMELARTPLRDAWAFASGSPENKKSTSWASLQGPPWCAGLVLGLEPMSVGFDYLFKHGTLPPKKLKFGFFFLL